MVDNKRASSPSGQQASNVVQQRATREGSYEPNVTPIVFYDEEVQRMHKELDQRPKQTSSQISALSKSTRPKRKFGVSITGFLARVALMYLLLAYYFVCPADPNREREVCRRLDSVQARLQSYEPLVRPYVNTAQRKIEPYLTELDSRTRPYVDKVRPYYDRFERVVGPSAQRLSDGYQQQVYPALIKGMHATQRWSRPYNDALRAQYRKSLAPSVEWYSRSLHKWYLENAEPQVSAVRQKVQTNMRWAQDKVAPVYTHGVPFARKHWRKTIVPAGLTTYSAVHNGYVDQVHPRLVTLSGHAHVFYRTRVLPALQRFYSLFIAPQLDKISERVFEYRTKKSRAEAVAQVSKTEKKVLHEHDADKLEDFIADLRNQPDDIDTSQLPSDADAVPAAQPPKAETTLSPAEQKIANAEKRRTLEAMQDSYERAVTKLGQKEHDLLLARLIEIRQHAIEDVPKRFDGPLQTLDDEADKMVGRLSKYFARAKIEEENSHKVEDKVADAEFLSKKAKAKVHKMAREVGLEVDEYCRQLESKEVKAVNSAQEAVAALVAKAQEELGYGWTWLDDVTAKDWQRYHGLGKAEKNWKENFAGTQNGSIKDSSLASLKPLDLLDRVKVQADSIDATLDSILDRIVARGSKEIRGEFTGVVNEAQKVVAAVENKAAAVASAAKSSVSSLAGIEPEPTNVIESASSVASVAQASAASLAQQALSAGAALDLSNKAASAYGEASQTVLRAVGVEPSPTDVRQSAAYVAHAASKSAGSAYAEASASILSLLGSTGRPTDLQGSITSLAKKIESSAAAALSTASSAVIVDVPAAASAVSEKVDAAVESGVSIGIDVASSLSSIAQPVASSLLAAAPTKAQLGSGAGAVVSEAAAAVSERAAEVASEASKLAAPHPAFSASQAATGNAAAATDAIKSRGESLLAKASSAVHDATRTTPEGVRETAQAVVDKAKSLVRDQVHVEL